MDKNILEILKNLKSAIDNSAENITKITSGNISHEVANIRSVVLNLTDVYISPNLDKIDDTDLKNLLKKTSRNLFAINYTLEMLNPTNVSEGGKKQHHDWLKFYSDALMPYIEKYAEI
jgi:hypothetical protein